LLERQADVGDVEEPNFLDRIVLLSSQFCLASGHVELGQVKGDKIRPLH
jgi:hypothetical protein